jgi:hypothetical protein
LRRSLSLETTLNRGGDITASKAFNAKKTGSVTKSNVIAIDPRTPNANQTRKMAMMAGRTACPGIGTVLFSFRPQTGHGNPSLSGNGTWFGDTFVPQAGHFLSYRDMAWQF